MRLVHHCAAAVAAAMSIYSVIGSSVAQPSDFSVYQPAINAPRIESDATPTIDGDLSDPEWAQAIVIDEFYQVEPTLGATPGQRTVIRLMYDARALYIAIQAYDDEPERIVANVMRRDGPVWNDDSVRVLLDTYNTRREAFFFQINPLGARFDALLEGPDRAASEWDTIWTAQSRIVEDGWVSEIRIPFQSISVDASAESWGLQFTRRIGRSNEQIRWSNIDQSRSTNDMSFAGRISGVRDIDNGRGLDVQAFGISRWTRNWEAPREDDFKFEASGNAYYKITPSLTGTLTLNTDFSDTPLDSRQVNTSRFSLFFPETRDFFLQDQQIFAFGGRGLSNDVNGRPFFSRRIGIVNGAPVDILAGAKLSGSLGRYNLGALTTRTRSTELLDPQQLSTVRVSAEVGAESRIGAVLVNGDPTGDTENTVLGVDYQFRNSNVFGGNQLIIDAYALKSISSEDSDEDESYGLEIAYPNDRFSGSFRFKQIGENFDPKLGFVNRAGIRSYNGNFRKRWRPQDSFIRHINLGTWYNFVTDLGNELESRTNGVWLGGVGQVGDELFLNLWNSFELIREPFTLPNDVVVPAGEYTWTRGSIFSNTAGNRRASLRFEFVCCDWFDGVRRDYRMEANFRPIRYFDLSISHDISDISLPTGDVTIHINSINANVNVTPNMNFSSEIQYDNISEGLTYFGRFRWEFRPETEIFVSLSHGAVTDFESFRSIQSSSVIRIGNTFRF